MKKSLALVGLLVLNPCFSDQVFAGKDREERRESQANYSEERQAPTPVVPAPPMFTPLQEVALGCISAIGSLVWFAYHAGFQGKISCTRTLIAISPCMLVKPMVSQNNNFRKGFLAGALISIGAYVAVQGITMLRQVIK